MGKKYIIELEDENYHQYSDSRPLDYLWRVKGFNTLVFDEVGIRKLTPYTAPDIEQVRKEAYRQGYDTGYSTKVNEFYEQGLTDAWEAARWIWTTPVRDLKKCFDIEEDNNGMLWPLHEYTASEAIAKIKEYEQKQEEIKVGDEVVGVFSDGSETRPFVFIRGSQEYYFGLYSDTGEFCQGGMNMRKTGRSFPEIAAVLEKMRGEKE